MYISGIAARGGVGKRIRFNGQIDSMNLSMESKSPMGLRRPMGHRYVSSSITFTAIERPSVTSKGRPHKLGTFRVPLLKSPTHFGHFSSRVNRLYNEDKYSASVLTIPRIEEVEEKQVKEEIEEVQVGKEGVKEAEEAGTAGSTPTSAVSDAVEGNDGTIAGYGNSATAPHTVFSFNIFDGHGGEQCSKFLASNLTKIIEESTGLVEPSDKIRTELIKKYWKNIGGYWKRWYKHRKDNFSVMFASDSQLRLENFPKFHDDLGARLPLGFLEADYEFFESDDNKSGSTCTSTFIETIYPNETEGEQVYDNYYFNRKSISKLTVAHIGDTKAILVDKNGEAHALTEAHHPSNPNEASRLRKYAANFFMTDSFGEERFISLANTRAFGDLNFKQMGVTAEPEISSYIIGDSEVIKKKLTKEEISQYTVGGLGGDECMLILITDGVTDILTDQEVADIIMVNVNMKSQKRATPQFCAEEVIKFVEYVGGDDNSTCLVIRLNGWGHWPILDRTGELRQERLNDFSPRGERT
ncbi:[Pyruvate dehydrogenase [acetyl-transferring]]-phosphatase 2, mitochondrial [[Candida] railenensis]|uniref:[Pyruvate dehydrogenase [acetyl-transferring]]-phosphatase 2, mitochondrial n=1 Tax=[Candida] railenensis TaxID=45579 RepID=A0A9P0VYS1_9ASCO|nr:[Pyruvate dehydrogenase [acetyl-transferring]]-phosphatase 2, mitochondrial [[Candida] railenensis]